MVRQRIWLLWGSIVLLTAVGLGGCAEVTKPQPTRFEVEEVQLTALTRHPQTSYQVERAMRVLVRLLPTLPRMHGRTYPFLGFNWWVTAAGQPVVDNVWDPSPARERPLQRQVLTLVDPYDHRPPPADREAALKRGDVILAVDGLSIPTWVKDWDMFIRSLREVFVYSFPAEALVDLVLTVRAAREESAGRYRGGPVTLLIDRQGVRRQVTLYPIYLPAEYGFLLVTGRGGQEYNAYAAPGRILLTRAMLEMCRTDDELAILLGHELAHQVHGHLARQQGQYPVAKLAGELVALPFRLLPWWENRPWRHLAEDIRRVSGQAVISVFNRQDEREADAYGLWYAYQAGFDIDQGIYLWERLAAVVSPDVLQTTYYLDSHPAAAERLARLKQIGQLYKAGRAASVFLP